MAFFVIFRVLDLGTSRLKRRVDGFPVGTVSFTLIGSAFPTFTLVTNVSPVVRPFGTTASNEIFFVPCVEGDAGVDTSTVDSFLFWPVPPFVVLV